MSTQTCTFRLFHRGACSVASFSFSTWIKLALFSFPFILERFPGRVKDKRKLLTWKWTPNILPWLASRGLHFSFLVPFSCHCSRCGVESEWSKPTIRVSSHRHYCWIQQLHVKIMMLQGFGPIPDLEDPASNISAVPNSLSLVSPRSGRERGFHSLHRQGPQLLSARSSYWRQTLFPHHPWKIWGMEVSL